MKVKLTFLLLLFTMIFYGQQYTLSGYIKDAKTGEALVGASVFIENNAKGTSTNVYGFYSITILSQSTIVRYSYIGYNQIEKSIDLNKDLRFNIELSEKQDVLDEVIIESKQLDQNTQSTQMGKIELSMDKVKTIPAFMGEVDILKTIQFLPGVSSGGEGNTGFYVRGGGPDQNLI